jgi:hypothetical protein
LGTNIKFVPERSTGGVSEADRFEDERPRRLLPHTNYAVQVWRVSDILNYTNDGKKGTKKFVKWFYIGHGTPGSFG